VTIKIIKLALVLSFILIGVLIWQKSSFFKKTQNFSQNKVEESSIKSEVVSGIKNLLGTKTQALQENIDSILDEKKEETISKILDKQKEEIEANYIAVEDFEKSTTEETKHYTIDYFKKDNMDIQLNKKETIYLSFKNFNFNQCLYINNQKYEIKKGFVLELKFNKTKDFQTLTNLCNLKYQEHGNFSVK
jgi:hypothetical protein